MVNNKVQSSTRHGILEILRNTDTVISGETIALKLGISRVAVWKGIQTLNENGYAILSTSTGYILEKDTTDNLFPWEFGAFESRYKHWTHTDSTMNRAKEAAFNGSEAGTVLIAENQSDGRGTGSKKWESVAGSLCFTLITRPNVNSSYSHRQILASQTAMARAIRFISGDEVFPQWPNDLYSTKGKIGGFLCEFFSSGNTVQFLNLGVGINTGPKPITKGTASISLNRKDLLQKFLQSMESSDSSSSELISQWNALCPFTGKEIRYSFLPETPLFTDGSIRTGIFKGVDCAGWAIIDDMHYPPLSISILNKGCEK